MLKDYLRKNNITWQEFADKAAISRQTVYNIMMGKITPRGSTIKKIYEATNGKVIIDVLNYGE